ncbi:MAG: hypothetical protein M3Y59_24375, partial [Myxococcota bacterium]|nr:hypothetical protein [Myxococcota bacterium]
MLNGMLALLLAAAPLKVALLPLEGGEGVNASTARSLTQAVLGEARKQAGIAVMSPDELGSILSLERQKALLGCSEDSCVAEVALALGVDRVLVGSVSKLGQSWLLHLKLLNANNGTVASQVDRRLKDKSIDDVLDAFPQAVSELFGTKGTVATAVPAQPAAAPAVTVVAQKQTAPGGRDEPFVFEGARPDFQVLVDGQGHLVVLKPFATGNTPVFSGDKNRVYAQRVIGGSSSGTESFDFVFWDARVPVPYMRSFGFKEKEGYLLQCGEKKIAFKPVPRARQARLLKGLSFLQPRWRRSGHTLARDDSGNYYYVDQDRDAKANLTDARLF